MRHPHRYPHTGIAPLLTRYFDDLDQGEIAMLARFKRPDDGDPEELNFDDMLYLDMDDGA